MIRNLLAATLTLALVGTIAFAQPEIDATIAEGEYANTLTEEESGATLYWTVEGDTLYMGMTMEAGGWIGIGWLAEQTNRKAGGDQLMFAIVDGEVVAYDAYQSSARGAPEMDEDEGGTNSVTAVAATQDGDAWTVEFSRHLATGEETDVDIVPGESYMLMLASSNTMDVGRQHSRSDRWYIEDFTF